MLALPHLQNSWAIDNIPYRFGSPLRINTEDFASISGASSALRSTVTWALNYIESVIDLRFVPMTAGHGISFNSGDITFDQASVGFANYGVERPLFAVDIVMEAAWASSKYVVLHEIGHALGLDHVRGTLDQTVMYDGVNPYDVSRVAAFGDWDKAKLWQAYGVSRKHLGDIRGTAWADTLTGGTGITDPADNGEQLFGFGGSDVLYGNGGNDTIFGGSGMVDPGDAADTLYGGLGDDIAYGNGGDDVFYATAGTDTFYGGLGADTAYLTPGSVFADFQAGIDTVFYI